MKQAETEGAENPSHLPDLEQIADLKVPLASDIDIPAYINSQFPTETHLSENLTPFLARLDGALHSLDAQLATLIRDHRNDTETTDKYLADTNTSLTALQDSLGSLAKAADEAERDINDALAPAKPIFTALQNTSRTSAALEALTTLDDAVQKLESAAASNLDVAATNLEIFPAIRESLDALPADSSLRRLPQLRARAAVANETLRSMLLTEFRRLSDVLFSPNVPAAKSDDAVARLRTACVVADAMGQDVRAEVVGTFVRSRRAAFRAAFEMDASGFSGVDRRFSWIRKELRSNWARLGGERVDRGFGRVFPDDWRVARRVADGVVQELREWTSRTLDAGADRDVAIMVSALSKTKEFEAELERRFAAISEDAPFVGVVSESFGPWMGAYVKQEDEHLKVVLTELLREEQWVCQDGTVLRSATELFLIIKKSMRTCASLDIRQPLFSLHLVFRKHLAAYASALVKHLPGVLGNALADSTNPASFQSKVQRACAIISTADYCSSTIEQLEESLKKTVQDVFTSDIDLGPERERFSTVSVKGIQSLVALLDEDLEADLRKMSEKDWASWLEVGDTSKYVQDTGEKLANSAKSLSALLSKHHFRFLMEKFVASFLARFRTHIYRCEQMNNFGAQQILLDVSAVKAMLLGLPASVHTSMPGTYTRYINREIGKVEAMLKVILAPLNMSVDTYIALLPDGTAEDFQKILEIRGLRRADAAPLVLDYSRRMGPEQRLKSVQAGRRMPEQSRSTAMSEKETYDNAHTKAANVPGSQEESSQAQSAADSMKNLFGRLGTSLKDAGITDRLGQVSSQFESTTDRLKKEAAARGFRFG